jgi:hypothetical protein
LTGVNVSSANKTTGSRTSTGSQARR